MNIEDIPNDDTGQAIRQWAREGSDLGKPLTIDFFVDVPDEKSGLLLCKNSALGDFKVSVEQDVETGRWTCYCAKKMIPDYQAVISVEEMLTKVARECGGAYDGFGSFGNAPGSLVH